MGVYVYSLRAKTVALMMPDGGPKAIANLFSYAYRLSWSDDDDRGYRLLVSNTERNANAVFRKDGRSGVVIVGDMSKPDGINGDAVYTNLSASQWYDTDKFPGTFVGWIEKVGRTYRVVDHTSWSECRVMHSTSNGDGPWISQRTRSVFVNGKIERQAIDIGSEADIEREVSESMALREAVSP